MSADLTSVNMLTRSFHRDAHRSPRWRQCLLVFLALLAPAANGAAQERKRPDRSSRRAEQVQEQPQTLPELLQRLDDVERELDRLKGQPLREAPADRTGSVVVMLEEAHLASTNVYQPIGIRYFVAQLAFINLTSEPVTVRTGDIRLDVDGKTLRQQDRRKELERQPIQTGHRVRSFQELNPPDEVTVAPGGSSSAWVLYSGLDVSSTVPRLLLTVPLPAGEHELDVNEYQRGVLGSSVERLGPNGCLALVTIGGTLTSINAGSLCDELDRLSQQGAARAVVAWKEAAAAPYEQLVGWLMTARVPRQNAQYSQLPVVPAAIRELHLANLPRSADVYNPGGEGGVDVHATTADAVLAALRSAYEVLPREQLLREIAGGHPLARAAALTHGAGRLSPDHLPLVLQCAGDPDEQVRCGALAALGHFGEPDAVARLVEVARGGELSTEALESLAGSRYPAAHTALLACLAEALPASRAKIVEVLAEHPNPLWVAKIYEYVHDEDPVIRLAALKALCHLGHPRLLDVLAEALESSQAELKNEAFARLVERTDADSERLALRHALLMLESAPPSQQVIALLDRTRDPRAVPLLLKHLDVEGDGNGRNRSQVLNLLSRIGGEDIDEAIAERFPKLTENEQATALESLRQLRSPHARRLATDALSSKKQALVGAAARVLGSDAGPEAVQVLADMLERSEESYTWSPVCNALADIGTPEARAILHKVRTHKNENKRTIARQAIQRMQSRSPGWHYSQQGLSAMSQEKWEEAEEFLTVAVELDPELSEAFSRRGHVRLKQNKTNEAGGDFREAAKLDPYDGQAVTGLGIVLAMEGKYDEAIEMVLGAAERFPDDLIYAYNTACVYGRALERLEKEEASSTRDDRIADYRSQALRHLGTSIRLGFEDFPLMRTDQDLEPLRKLAEFQKLLPEEKPGETPPPPAETEESRE